MRPVWDGQLITWRHRDALRAGDPAGAATVRAEARAFVLAHPARSGFIPGSTLFPLVHDTIEHGDLDAAADELRFWADRADLTGVEEDNARRTDCRQLLASLLTFLEHPDGRGHPSASELRRRATWLRDQIREVLTVDLERRSRHVAAEHLEPAGPPTVVPDDPLAQLVTFGHYCFDPTGSDVDPGAVWSRIVAPRYEAAVADPVRFCRELADATMPVGGWAMYGAQRLVVELLGGDCQDLAFLAMQDAALAWLHDSGVPSAHLTGYEMARWTATRGAWAASEPSSPDDRERDLVGVLRTFVAATGPLLAGLRAVDIPLDEGRGSKVGALRERVRDALTGPGSPDWPHLDVDTRADWWVSRVGTVLASVTTAAHLTGLLADRTALQPVLRAAAQGVVLCAVADEHGVTADDRKIELLAEVLFGRTLTVAPGGSARPAARPAIVGATAIGKEVVRLARSLRSWRAQLAPPPKQRGPAVLGRVPVVRAAVGFTAERSALHEAVAAGSAWLAACNTAGSEPL